MKKQKNRYELKLVVVDSQDGEVYDYEYIDSKPSIEEAVDAMKSVAKSLKPVKISR